MQLHVGLSCPTCMLRHEGSPRKWPKRQKTVRARHVRPHLQGSKFVKGDLHPPRRDQGGGGVSRVWDCRSRRTEDPEAQQTTEASHDKAEWAKRDPRRPFARL